MRERLEVDGLARMLGNVRLRLEDVVRAAVEELVFRDFRLARP